ncbi:MAG: YdcF family protein [Bryobacteraceae bacterium]
MSRALLRRAVLPFLLLCTTLWFGREQILPVLAGLLVYGEEPVKSDLIVVLAGDPSGNRIIKGAELVRQGFAPQALISGPYLHYDAPESDLAIAFALHRGFPESYFIPYPIHGLSTREEAALIVPELRRRGVKRLLVVTHNYHTRRAGRLWREAAPEMEIHMIAAPAEHFDPANWWRNREGRKTFFYESVKAITSPFGV